MANRLEQARATLGVSASSTMEEARKAYRTMALRTHPDKNPDDPEANQKFQMVQDAWDLLQRCDNDTEYYNSDDENNAEAAYYHDGDYDYDDEYDEEDDEDLISKIILMEMLFQSMCAEAQGFPSADGGDGRRQRSRRGQRYGRSGGRQRNPFSSGPPGSGFSSRGAGGFPFPFSPSDMYSFGEDEDEDENDYRGAGRQQQDGTSTNNSRDRKKKGSNATANFATDQTSNAAMGGKEDGKSGASHDQNQSNNKPQQNRKKKGKKKKSRKYR